MKKRDYVKLSFDGAKGLSFSLSPQRVVEIRIGARQQGSTSADKVTTKVIFALADVALMRERKNTGFQIDAAFTEVAGLAISRKGKSRRFKFAASGPPMPDYLRALVREMVGLIKW